MPPRATSKSLPLVTMVIFAYNQERFIRAAVEGALAQTYQPLEIILSDDCSDDRTFDVMSQASIEAASHHVIRLNRNEVNLGIGAHINRMMELANGELVVVGAGDDVSMPNRVEMLMQCWRDSGFRFDAICSDMYRTDREGRRLRYVEGRPFMGSIPAGVKCDFGGLQGASAAWTAQLWRAFGDLLPGTVCEDRAVPLRAALMGGVGYVPEPLVEYRVHDRNLSHFHATEKQKVIETTAEIHYRNATIALQHLKDLRHAQDCGIQSGESVDRALRIAQEKSRVSAIKAGFLRGGWVARLRCMLAMLFVSPRQAARMLGILLFPARYARQQARNLGLSG